MDIAAPTTAAPTTAAPTTATPTTPRTVPARSAINADFDTFLKMLTAQMKNQDPLNPMDSADFAVQLATFSGVEQQMKTNDLLATLNGQSSLTNMAQLAGWVGMEARAASPVWFDGGPVTLAPNPGAAADSAVLVVTDGDGNLVSREDVAITTDALIWNGTGPDGLPLPPGTYSFALESYAGETLLGTTPVDVYSTIVEARGGSGGTVLVMTGGIEVPAGDVTALRDG